MLYGSPVARALDSWWASHAGRHDDPAWQAFLEDEANLLRTKRDELAREHSNAGPDGRKRFGMSKAAGCTRAATLKLLGHEEAPFSGSTLATFHIGHLLECSAIATLHAAGYQTSGTQEVVTLDPFMASASDDVIVSHYDGVPPVPVPCLLSVKTAGYKMSGRRGAKWVRQGFAALPFEGVRKEQPSWWAQAQAEMHGTGITHTLVLVKAKDIVKVFENDPYLGPEGNGSLTFYTELIEYDPHFAGHELLPVWGQAWSDAQDGRAGQPMFLRGSDSKYIRLPAIADTANGWGGPNKEATGTFNPCNGCGMAGPCKDENAKGFRR